MKISMSFIGISNEPVVMSWDDTINKKALAASGHTLEEVLDDALAYMKDSAEATLKRMGLTGTVKVWRE